MTVPDPYILLDDQVTSRVRRYDNPVEIITVKALKAIEPAFKKLQSHLDSGRYIAGYFSYELGYALEPKLAALMPKKRKSPLMQFGVFDTVSFQDGADLMNTELTDPVALIPTWTQAQYTARFRRVKAYLKAGDVYQINLTFPMSGPCDASAAALYAAFRQRQRGKYGGLISLGGPDIISLSPELFFETDGETITTRPMKGTIRRMANKAEDAAASKAMQTDQKSMAENLMIVDLLRNDLSRISLPGSVTVPELYALETYPTLHQMTSEVQAQLKPETGLRDLIGNLFPSGSITGAPKIRAMEIIHELEETPRGAYCGSMGYVDPSGKACFNVGIRTLTLDKGQLTYNVGSGVVLDSKPSDEYAECLLKAKVLEPPGPYLIETLRWTPRRQFLRREYHIDRLARSAADLGYPTDKAQILLVLKQAIRTKGARQRVRLTLSEYGALRTECEDYFPLERPWRVSLSKNPLSSDVQYLDHKISDRTFYDNERERVTDLTGCDEVIFLNAKNEICEGSITSVFIEKEGQMLTPTLSCGLLPGVLRQSLIESGAATEAVLTLDDLRNADLIFVGNSLRGLIKAELTSFDRH